MGSLTYWSGDGVAVAGMEGRATVQAIAAASYAYVGVS